MTHPTESRLSAPDHDAEVAPIINLRDAAAELLASARSSRPGRSAHTLVPGAGAALKQTLMALVSGVVLADHESPGTATLQVLTGSVRLTGGPQDLELHAGDHAPIPETRHGLVAMEDAVVLISVGHTPVPLDR
ncbi:MAG TPA: hypothetical protein VMM13_08100 [Euzebya sp.]|nr:hypothetical protein [Euzebya sp.]